MEKDYLDAELFMYLQEAKEKVKEEARLQAIHEKSLREEKSTAK